MRKRKCISESRSIVFAKSFIPGIEITLSTMMHLFDRAKELVGIVNLEIISLRSERSGVVWRMFIMECHISYPT